MMALCLTEEGSIYVRLMKAVYLTDEGSVFDLSNLTFFNLPRPTTATA